MILITGGEGLVGSNIPGDDLIITDITEDCPEHLDVTDAEQTMEMITRHQPDAVVHCAAWIDPDQCEKDPLTCYQVNVVGTINVARACKEVGAKLVYISTQLVFDGNKQLPYTEEDPAEPLQAYGMTHFCAEQYAKALENHLILRTSLCHGSTRKGRRYGFIYWVIDSLREGKEINVVDTLWTNPTDIVDFGNCIRRLIDADARGTFHYAGEKFLSRYEYAVVAAEFAGLDPALINRIEMSTLMDKWVATRPIRAGLSSDKVRKAFGIEPGDAFAWLKRGLKTAG